MPALSTILQLVIAIIIVLVLFAIGFFVYNRELLSAIRNVTSNKKATPVFRGVLDLGLLPVGTSHVYDTNNPNAPNYVELNPAYNQMPGAEFSYNFWLYLDYKRAPPGFNEVAQKNAPTIKEQDTGLDATDYILVLRGDALPKTYKSICRKRNKIDIMVKCPLIKLENGWDNLTVEFNTVSSPDAVHNTAKDQCKNTTSTNWLAMNNHKISVYGMRNGPNASRYNKKWFMVTVVIKDTSPDDPIPIRNKARCSVYVNGVKELDHYVDGKMDIKTGHASVLKQNSGNLYVGPKIGFQDAKGNTIVTGSPLNTGNTTSDAKSIVMADLSYYNYGLDPATISSLFTSGFNKNTAPSSTNPLMQEQSYLDSISLGSTEPQLEYL